MSLLNDPIAEQAGGDEPHVALATAEGSWTYAALDRWVQVVEGRLLANGCAPGSVVAVEAPQGARKVALLWALWRTGAIAVPLNTRHPAPRCVEQARQAGAQRLVRVVGEETTDRGAESAREAGISVLSFDMLTEEPPPIRRLDDGDGPPGGPAVGGLLDGGTVRATQLPLSARATGVFTSGSTGRPKLAVHTLGNHVYSARGSAENIAIGPGDRWLLSLPLYHVGGLAILFRCALAGATVALPDDTFSLTEAVERLRPTHLSLVATQLKRLLDADATTDMSGLKAILLGGSAIPPALLDRASARGWPVRTSYGSTEMASQITTTPPDADRETLATSGHLLPHRTLDIVDGEICVGGRTLFAGYAAEEGAGGPLKSGRDDQERFRTGDLGHWDADQRLHVTGRADRLIISGGENIQPEEIEAALRRLDGVERAAVVGVPDDEYGERPIAFVKWADDASPRCLRADLRATLPGYKLPDAVHPMPNTAVEGRMKVDYEELELTARKLRD